MLPEGNKQESMAALLRLSDRLNAGSERVLFVLMVAMIFLTTLQVIARVFFTALSWSEELTCFLLFFASLLGAAIAFKRGTHIAVTMIATTLPKGGQKALAIGVHILGIVFFAVVAIYGALFMKAELHQISPAMQIPMILVYAIFPILGGVIILHLIVGIGQVIRRD